MSDNRITNYYISLQAFILPNHRNGTIWMPQTIITRIIHITKLSKHNHISDANITEPPK